MSEELRYIRFSILVGVPASVAEEDDVVENDIRDMINGDLCGEDVPYGMVLSGIDRIGDETR